MPTPEEDGQYLVDLGQRLMRSGLFEVAVCNHVKEIGQRLHDRHKRMEAVTNRTPDDDGQTDHD